MVDIALSVLLAVLTLYTAYLGVHVTLHPAESDQEKSIYKWKFRFCAFLICAAIAFQGYRNKESQDALAAKLTGIDNNTKQPPRVEVNLPTQPSPSIQVNLPKRESQMSYISSDANILPNSYGIGKQIIVNYTIRNTSDSVVARKVVSDRLLVPVPTDSNGDVTQATQDSRYKAFALSRASRVGTDETTVAPKESLFASVGTPNVTEQMDKDFRSNKETLLFMDSIVWKDDAGTHTSKRCEWIKMSPEMFAGPKLTAAEIVWHLCARNN